MDGAKSSSSHCSRQRNSRTECSFLRSEGKNGKGLLELPLHAKCSLSIALLSSSCKVEVAVWSLNIDKSLLLPAAKICVLLTIWRSDEKVVHKRCWTADSESRNDRVFVIVNVPKKLQVLVCKEVRGMSRHTSTSNHVSPFPKAKQTFILD